MENNEIEGLKNANRELGRMLDERDKQDKRIGITWYALGIITGVIICMFI